MIDDVATKYGAQVIRTAVGEANVVAALKPHGSRALLGGEGNGGVIFPKVCWVRDSLSAMALTLSMLAQARADIAQRAPRFTPRVLFVSVDPARDTPERIAAYLNGFDAEFAGVTAPDAELAPLLAQLGVAVEKQHDHGGGGNYNVVHNSAIYVLDPNAEWIAVSTGPHDPKVFASDYLRIRQRHAGSGGRPPGA